jgi:hypothetical protein
LLRRYRKRVAIAFRRTTRHENPRRQDRQATSVALGPSMRSESFCANRPFDPRAAPSQRLLPYKTNAPPYRHALPSAICRTTSASVRPAQRASIPIDAPASSGSAQSRFIRGRHAALATSNKPPDSSWPLGGGQRCMGRPYSEDLRRRIVAAVFARARRLAVRRRVRRSCSAGTRAVPRHRFRRASSRSKRSPRHSRYRRLRGAPFWHLFRRLGHYGHR